ncbi:MAG: hypothetical protein ABSA41_08880 [Terriglobia bacterium]|jgi:hypothetical protein
MAPAAARESGGHEASRYNDRPGALKRQDRAGVTAPNGRNSPPLRAVLALLMIPVLGA